MESGSSPGTRAAATTSSSSTKRLGRFVGRVALFFLEARYPFQVGLRANSRLSAVNVGLALLDLL